MVLSANRNIHQKEGVGVGGWGLKEAGGTAGPISPNRGVRRGAQRLGGGVTLRSKTANPQ
jgi:hypothetical protein